MRRLVLTAAVAAMLGIPVTGAQAAPGDLDASFGDSGIVRTNIGAADSFDEVHDLVIDSLGRIVVVGSTSTPIGDDELVIARYLSDGSLDSSFGAGGIVKSSAGAADGVAVDSLGRIVIAGRGQEGSETGVLVARFLATGVPDASFGGGDGIVVENFTGEFDGAAGVAIDGSGRIVIAGGAPHVLVARFLENGAVDTTFGGGDGYFAETMNDPTTGGLLIHGLRDLALDSAGRIVAVSGGFVAMRFTTSGARDLSFGGGDGVVAHRVASGDDATAVAIDSTGGILVGGRTGNAIEEPVVVGFDFAVVRYSESGVLDTAFGDGDSMAVADGGLFDYATDLALDGNGRIVLGGAASDFAVARFLPSGRISGSFGGGDGVVATDLDDYDLGTAIAVDASGRVVLGGNAESDEEEGSDFALLRYEGGPAVDVFHALSVQVAGEGEGTVSGIGIDCGTDCTDTYDEGTVVTLTAIPAHDELGEVEAVFTGWSGACSGEAETCEVTMSEAREVAASFEPFPWEEEPPVEEEPPTEEPPSSSPPAGSPLPPVAIVSAPAPTSSPKAKPRKCRKGFVKRKVRGKARCVKRKRRRR